MELAEDFAEYIYFGVKSITVSSNFSQWLSCKENKLQTGLIDLHKKKRETWSIGWINSKYYTVGSLIWFVNTDKD